MSIDTGRSHFQWQYEAPSYRLAIDILDDAQPFIKSEPDDELMLTLPSPSHSRPPSVPPFATLSDPFSPAAISTPLNNNTYKHLRQDVSTVLNNSAGLASTSTVTRINGLQNGSSLPSSSQNVSINQSSSLRTFTSPQELATHYGIPQFLPPVPRTTPSQNTSPETTYSDFAYLKSNYLSMLSNKPGESSMAVDTPTTSLVPATMSPPQAEMESPQDAVRHFLEVLASPEFRDAHSFDGVDNYLTSPLLSTPYETPLDDFTSPLDDSPYTDFLTTPLIPDESEPLIADDFGALPLFPDVSLGESTGALFGGPVVAQQDVMPKLPEIEKLLTISPSTPALDAINPASVYPSPNMPSVTSFTPVSKSTRSPASTSTSLASKKSSATGTRKNVTPSSIVQLDDPIQPRKYVAPSATSRKEVPAVFARKRSRAQAFGAEEDELNEPLAPNSSEKEQIEWKRKQNTLAARKSRKRKLEHQQYLETRVENLEREVEIWRTRTETLQSILKSHGIPVAEFPPTMIEE